MPRSCRTRGCRNEAMPDSLDCRECLIEYLRRTRAVSPWVQRMQEGRGVAKVFGRAA